MLDIGIFRKIPITNNITRTDGTKSSNKAQITNISVSESYTTYIENGYKVAFGGNITYNRAKSFKRYMDMLPVEQIVIETDCPYLPPEPLRGTVNTSKNLPIILNKLAEYKNIDVEELAKIVYRNSLEFFNIKE